MGTLDAGQVGQRFLRNPAFRSQCAHCGTEGLRQFGIEGGSTGRTAGLDGSLLPFLACTIPLSRFCACTDSMACAFVFPRESTHPLRQFRASQEKRILTLSDSWDTRP
jgi:hypothetical protein